VVLVVLVPLALYVLLRGNGPEQAGNPPPATGPTATGPTATATASPAPAPTATGGEPAPDGRIPLATLKNSTIDVPPWPADNLGGLSGPLTFVDGQVLSPPDATFPFERYIVILDATYADLDGDGAQETLADIGCVVQGGSAQIVALDRDTAGRIVTLGTVVATTGDVRTIDNTSVRVDQNGTVFARVADYQRGCGDETPMLWQTRGYAWTGSKFHQAAGPASFPVNPSVTETGVTAGELVFGPAVSGTRHSTLTVTVAYLRGAKPDHLRLVFSTPPGVQQDGSAWPPTGTDNTGTFFVELPTPAQGASAVYTFAFSRPEPNTDGDFHVALRGITRTGGTLSESNPYNNGPAVTVRTTG
jgi:hypothetical protein